MWGCEASEDRTATKAFYKWPGLKCNDRSSKDVLEGSYCGSYNIAVTVGKGEGQGCVLLAAQIDNPITQVQIGEMLNQLSFMGTLILKTTLNQFESTIIKFHALDNNLMSYGNSGPYMASCQINISESMRDLALSFGIAQGYWHTDFKDDFTRWTLCTLTFRLPPGMFIYSHIIYYHTKLNV